MTPTRWHHIEVLFEAALEKPAEERPAFLQEACAGDDDLLQEVETLLAFDEPAAAFFDDMAHGVVARSISELEVDGLDRVQIGPYRLLRELGRGGMGAVYLAEQTSGSFRRYVALKRVKRGMDTDAVQRRFRQERDVLASLNHSHIARLIDGGATADGSPYFVMEYVEGEPIDLYCTRKRLSVDERLALFMTVCRAVQHAHQKLVIHRDLKPGNILVTEDGTVKLLDFGIAKLLNLDQADEPTLTQTGFRIMTPEYASPEQVRKQPLTTASDVYQLGILLYKLLTGTRPYSLSEKSTREIDETILHTAPFRPSVTVSTLASDTLRQAGFQDAEALRRRLRGDLDTIVLMALRKEPERRYASVDQFREDLQRHLDGLPVVARPDTFRYRTQKFVRRNLVSVSLACGALLVIVGLGTQYAMDMTRERDRARLEAVKAEQAASFMTSLIGEFGPDAAHGGTIEVETLLERGTEKVRDELAGQPDVQARVLGSIGEIYGLYGWYEDAAALMQDALDRYEEVYDEIRPDMATRMKELAWIRFKQGRYDEAEPLLRETLEIRRRLFGARHPDVAESLSQLGTLLQVRGQQAEAERLHREALDMRRALLGNDHPAVATSLNDLAFVLREGQQYEEAVRLYREALVVRRSAFGNEHTVVAQTLTDLGQVLTAQGQYDEAEPYVREALAIRRNRFGDEHPQVAQSLSHLGLLLQEQGQYDEAEYRFREALALRRALLGDQHLAVANSLNTLGWLLYRKEEYAAGEPHLRQAVMLYRALLGDEHRYVAATLAKLAVLLEDKEDYPAAEAAYREALTLRRRVLGERHSYTTISMTTLGLLLVKINQLDEAEDLLRNALIIRQDLYADDHWRIGQSKRALGACLTSQGRYTEAEPLLLEAHALLLAKRGPDDWQTRRTVLRLSELYEAMEQPEKAAPYLALLAETDQEDE